MSNLNKFLVVIVVLLLLFTGGMGYYTYFVWDGNKQVEDKPKEPIIEPELPNETALQDEVKKTMPEFPYAQIINAKVTYEELNELYMLSKSVKTFALVESDANNQKLTKDKDGVDYPKYTANSAQAYGKLLGLTVAEIEKMDVDSWKQIIGKNVKLYMFNGAEVKSKITELNGTYGTMFDMSFVANEDMLGTVDTSLTRGMILYDKNIDKVVYYPKTIGTPATSTTGTLRRTYITSDKVVEKEYMVEFVEGYFGINKDGTYSLNVNTAEKKINVTVTETGNELENALKDNQDKLDKYEVTFKKVDNKYQFDSIKKI